MRLVNGIEGTFTGERNLEERGSFSNKLRKEGMIAHLIGRRRVHNLNLKE